MLAKALTSVVVGLDGQLIEVEVDIPSRGLPNFIIAAPGPSMVPTNSARNMRCAERSAEDELDRV